MTEDHINKTAQTANNAIAALAEAAKIEQRVDGQGVRYWAEVAAHSMARNDTLISQLKEKEKIAAEQEQRITSLQNEILNQVYAGTQEDLKAELERVHAAAAEWERKYNKEVHTATICEQAIQERLESYKALAEEFREKWLKASIQLDSRPLERAIKGEPPYPKGHMGPSYFIEGRGRVSKEEWYQWRADNPTFKTDEERKAPVAGKTYHAVTGHHEAEMTKDEFYAWIGENAALGLLTFVKDSDKLALAVASST